MLKEFSFRYRVRPANLWVLSMINIYRSIVGVVNFVFTVSMIMLAYRFWPETGLVIRLGMTAGILLFPVFQPLMILFRSRKIVRRMPGDMRMDFDDKGMTIVSEERNSHVNYKDLKSVVRVSGMLILYTQNKQGFILDRRVLENRGTELYDFLVKKVRA